MSLIKKLLNPLQPRFGKKREQTKIITIQETASGSKLNTVVYSLLLKNIATLPQKSQLKLARDLEACQKNEIHKIDNSDKKTEYSIRYLFPAQAQQVWGRSISNIYTDEYQPTRSWWNAKFLQQKSALFANIYNIYCKFYNTNIACTGPAEGEGLLQPPHVF